MKHKLFLIFLFLFTITLYSDEPSWVYLRQAQNKLESGEYAEALILARRSKQVLIREQLELYYQQISRQYTDKIAFELRRMVDEKERELQLNDNYPAFHELVGDIYVLTDFLDEAIREYRIALNQKEYFEYSDKEIEINYKLAGIYQKKREFETADIIYREIAQKFFQLKNREYWNRIKTNITDDATLAHVFRIYRINGIVYQKALYEIGRRSAILQRTEDALFYLVCAAIVWMTYYDTIIKTENFFFSYSGPADFINFVTKSTLGSYRTNDYIIDEIMFYIGYANHLNNQMNIRNHFFNLATKFAEGTDRSIELRNRINYFNLVRDYRISYNEIIF